MPATFLCHSTGPFAVESEVLGPLGSIKKIRLQFIYFTFLHLIEEIVGRAKPIISSMKRTSGSLLLLIPYLIDLRKVEIYYFIELVANGAMH